MKFFPTWVNPPNLPSGSIVAKSFTFCHFFLFDWCAPLPTGYHRHCMHGLEGGAIANFCLVYPQQEDQRALRHVLWPEIKSREDVLQHDSYLCTTYPGSRPFPSQRQHSGDFVGAPSLRMSGQHVKEPCPVECRPPQHKDWLYC